MAHSRTGQVLVLALAVALLTAILFRRSPSDKDQGAIGQHQSLIGLVLQATSSERDSAVIELRENGPEAVNFLAEQLARRDSMAKRIWVVVWPHLPIRIRAKLPQPFDKVLDRVQAATALHEMGPEFSGTKPALKAVLAALEDPSPEVRSIAVSIIGDIGPNAAAAVPWFIQSVRKGENRMGHLWVLGRMGRNAESALPQLQTIMRTGTDLEQGRAACASWRIKPEHPQVVGCLTKGLASADPMARASAAATLRLIGGPARIAMPELRVALKDQHPSVRFEAACALAVLDPQDPRDILIATLTTPAATNAGSTPIFEQKNLWRCLQASETLLLVEPRCEPAINFLRQLLEDQSNPELAGAITLRDRLALRRTLHKGDDEIRISAASILARNRIELDVVVPVLEEAVGSSERAQWRVDAAIALGTAGTNATHAIPALALASKSRDPVLHKVSVEALKSVAGEKKPVPPSH